MGLYVNNSFLRFYDEATSPVASFAENVFAQVVLTRDFFGNVVGYVNGVQEIAFTDSSDLAVISDDDFLIFFRDDNTSDNTENSPGSVACILVYDEVLSAVEISRIDCLALQTTIPTLSKWGLIAMAAILGIVGFMVIRRRKITA